MGLMWEGLGTVECVGRIGKPSAGEGEPKACVGLGVLAARGW